ncbi:hypothetical protein QV08_06255 [Gallibacterium salpingitidis]|uniref:DUF1778 domain-containing protein n=1 Tax=Gallibacterium salpingitidis TaxID=505341 RepID=A0AB36E463_9PAST|nr:DUF1778 domain-containing protein [Gallibacterium salpingitidis]OBX07957.1 hypothetical protein QV08_06255 [Gallibacterium salpingitidis]OBX11450.1 hypothetical protein QV09_02440 [Gallibacterium salpingitidis]WKT00756.1 DUF1778 domain-containing protein [Gallibacterium salpingitidis]
MHATERISIRTTPHAKAVIEQASSLLGLSVSQFILSTVYDKSVQMLKDQQIWSASEEDLKMLDSLLAEEPKATKELQELLKLGASID